MHVVHHEELIINELECSLACNNFSFRTKRSQKYQPFVLHFILRPHVTAGRPSFLLRYGSAQAALCHCHPLLLTCHVLAGDGFTEWMACMYMCVGEGPKEMK